jgi:hypothetical protein
MRSRRLESAASPVKPQRGGLNLVSWISAKSFKFANKSRLFCGKPGFVSGFPAYAQKMRTGSFPVNLTPLPPFLLS